MTSKIPYTAPSWKKKAFNCAFCNAYANQIWFDLNYYDDGYKTLGSSETCYCTHCRRFSIWYQGKMIYPDFSGIEPPNEDLSDDIVRDYEEAASILQKSPRGSAALLRLAIQKLCLELSGKKNLNEAIAKLVKQGLPKKIQQSMDTLRVIGNEAVHPGKLDLKDDTETAEALFRLLNFVSEKMITEPREIEAIYDNKVPDAQKDQIEKRDGS